ncbi:MAG: maleylacetoacetate isomerase [Wenzhouxiangella sp.]|nr:MAG: maleylacetoacetate isomerase [Wenzhouxiangella sp.]
MILYSYWRSSASFRVRMALELKKLDFEIRPVHLLRDGGQQFAPDYQKLNAQQLVPTLVHGDLVLGQSLAIIEYLDEAFPHTPLLPESAAGRAWARMLAQVIACDVHPLNNLRVLGYLVEELGASESDRLAWYRRWSDRGLASVERLLRQRRRQTPFCHGEEPGLADCCLLPQVYNARRFDCRLEKFECILGICARLEALKPVQAAAPENQADAE